MVPIVAAHHIFLHDVLQWRPDFDWVAVGTLALAFGTAYLGVQTKKAAQATASEAEASRKELQASQRPLLAPTGFDQQEFTITVVNVGPGVALDCTAILFVGEVRQPSARVQTIGPGAEATVPFPPEGFLDVLEAGNEDGELEVVLQYKDVAEMLWWTRALMAAETLENQEAGVPQGWLNTGVGGGTSPAPFRRARGEK